MHSTPINCLGMSVLGGIESSSRSLIQKVMYRVEVMLKDLEKTIYNK